MDDYYSLLGVDRGSSPREIKQAFRERAKRLHPDIAGKDAGAGMRRLLAAYQTLSDRDRRFEYDRAYTRFMKKNLFDYRRFLRERSGDPGSQAKLIFFQFLHMEDADALEIWTKNGGLDFPLQRYLDREDWMDCAFLLAEELDRQGRPREAFTLLVQISREERRRPYFKHFMEDIEIFLKELVRLRLRPAVDEETYVECLEFLLDLGFSSKDESRFLRSMAETLFGLGETFAAKARFAESLRRDPAQKRPSFFREDMEPRELRRQKAAAL